MWGLITFLIFSAVVIPYALINYDEPLTQYQWQVATVLGWIAFTKATVCLFLNVITANYSQIDKLWSVIPMVYVWVATLLSGMHERQVIMAGLVTIWGCRLTFNFARKGGFAGISCGGKSGFKFKFWEGEEDYRWAILR